MCARFPACEAVKPSNVYGRMLECSLLIEYPEMLPATGTVGFVGCYMFVRKIYSIIKVD